uniref:AlNc14C162G7799 protein n=1 Tax=Albugo laibachii Nc14 TaxID=890382 RepID=F0WMW3_9STRA|nr:AlNc14C162G7799 [Albugo laibachii Nc14]|eukprot:CCA22648.1 AlNc14C162G7799 [Albugo laibachii Nc14]
MITRATRFDMWRWYFVDNLKPFHLRYIAENSANQISLQVLIETIEESYPVMLDMLTMTVFERFHLNPFDTAPNNRNTHSTRIQDDDERDETFKALQQMFKTLSQSQMEHPNDSNYYPEEDRSSQEELLEQRRSEREYYRHYILESYSTNNKEFEDEEETESVEGAIRGRLLRGSFSSSLNMQVISRTRWNVEEKERLPLVKLPAYPTLTSPADNPHLHVTFTEERIALRKRSGSIECSRHLNPPRSTWHFQMQHLSPLKGR